MSILVCNSENESNIQFKFFTMPFTHSVIALLMISKFIFASDTYFCLALLISARLT